MERRRRQQRLKINERQGRCPHVHRHRRPARLDLYGAFDHFDDPLSRHRQRPPGWQVDPLHQHHRQPRQWLRQQIPRVQEGGENMGFAAHRQGDSPPTAPFVPPVDQLPKGADAWRQQAKAVDRRPQGHRAQEHAAGPGACLPQSQQQQPASQQQRCGEQGQQRPHILPAAHQQRRGQETPDPPRQTQQPRPFPQGDEVPEGSRQGREGRPARPHRHAAQGPGQLQQQPVHGEVIQQKPFQGDPHATSMTMTVMSSRWPLSLAAARRDSAIRSRGWAEPFFSSASMSLPSRS